MRRVIGKNREIINVTRYTDKSLEVTHGLAEPTGSATHESKIIFLYITEEN